MLNYRSGIVSGAAFGAFIAVSIPHAQDVMLVVVLAIVVAALALLFDLA